MEPTILQFPKPPLPSYEEAIAFKRKKKGKLGNLPRHVTTYLSKWILEHAHNPYPTEEEKEALCRRLDIPIRQLNNWFVNARRRILRKVDDPSSSQVRFEVRANDSPSIDEGDHHRIGEPLHDSFPKIIFHPIDVAKESEKKIEQLLLGEEAQRLKLSFPVLGDEVAEKIVKYRNEQIMMEKIEQAGVYNQKISELQNRILYLQEILNLMVSSEVFVDAAAVNSKYKNPPELRSAFKGLLLTQIAPIFEELKMRNEKNPMEFLSFHLFKIAKTFDQTLFSAISQNDIPNQIPIQHFPPLDPPIYQSNPRFQFQTENENTSQFPPPFQQQDVHPFEGQN